MSENRETAYRGAPLAEDASPETTPPDPFEQSQGSIRGAGGLAEDGAAQGPPPDAGEKAHDGIRGDGLAEDEKSER
jgi:hypothetical protein